MALRDGEVQRTAAGQPDTLREHGASGPGPRPARQEQLDDIAVASGRGQLQRPDLLEPLHGAVEELLRRPEVDLNVHVRLQVLGRQEKSLKQLRRSSNSLQKSLKNPKSPV